MSDLIGVAYNLDNYREDRRVKDEVESLLRDGEAFLVYVEGAEYADELARVRGYTQHTTRGKGGSERDAGILVRDDIPTKGYRLARTKQRWPKDKAPGMHWPRSFPSVKVTYPRVVAVHMPRQIHKLAYAACWLRLLTLALTTRGPLLLVGDWNKGAHRRGAFTPRLLARLTGCKVHSAGGIDYVLARGCKVSGLKHRPGMGSDHDPIEFIVKRSRRNK